MSVNSYTDFLENPLNLDERYPTIEEFLLSIPHFFVKKDSCVSQQDYEAIKKNIEESKKGNRNLSKSDVFNYLNFFDFGSHKPLEIWNLFLDRIFKGQTVCTKKNFYLREIIYQAFKTVWDLQTEYKSYWISRLPNDKKPFTQLLKEYEKNEDKELFKQYIENKELDAYRKWLNGATPQISSLDSFLEKIKHSCQKLSLAKEKVLSFWFWQKFNDLYPFSDEDEFTEHNAKSEEIYAEKYDSLLTKIDFNQNITEFADELEQAKKTWPPVLYGNILLLDFKFNLHKKNCSEAINLAQKMATLYFYYGSYKSAINHSPTEWYNLITSFIAYGYSICKNKDDKKSIKSLFKRIYRIAEILEIEKIQLNKDTEKIILDKYKDRFEQEFQSRYWKKQEVSIDIPKPDYKKANQHKINWGTARNCPQLVFFTQLNKPEIIQGLLKHGASISASTLSNESALYWCLKHLAINEHLSVGKTTLCPPESPLCNTKAVEQYIYRDKNKPFLTFSENFKNTSDKSIAMEKSFTVFKEIFDGQREKAKNIFNAILPYYQNPKGSYHPIATFKSTTVAKENILNKAICTLDLDIIKAVVALYEKYQGSEKKKEWINTATEFTPRTPIFWLIRLFERKENRKSDESHLNKDPFQSKFLSQPNFIEFKALSELDAYPNNPYNYSDYLADITEKCTHPGFNYCQNVLDVWESRYLDESVSENDFLTILQYLLENEANPLEICDCSTINRPNDYNALKLATEIGWLKAVSMMTEWLQDQKKIQIKEIEELRQLAIDFEKIWDRGSGMNFFEHEKRAKKCHIVSEYFQKFIPDSFYEKSPNFLP